MPKLDFFASWEYKLIAVMTIIKKSNIVLNLCINTSSNSYYSTSIQVQLFSLS